MGSLCVLYNPFLIKVTPCTKQGQCFSNTNIIIVFIEFSLISIIYYIVYCTPYTIQSRVNALDQPPSTYVIMANS